MLRKTYKVNIPVKSFNESTLQKKENNSLKDRPKAWIADLHLTVSDENVLQTSNIVSKTQKKLTWLQPLIELLY